MTPFSLEDKHIVISGASSGIGRQCAISCAEFGAKVSLLGRDIQRLKESLSLMKNKDRHSIYSLDLTDERLVLAVVSEIVGKKGEIHGLLNCAGISDTLLLRSINTEKLDYFFKNNVYSSVFLTKAVCKKGNINKERASVVFFSSVMGTHGEVGKSLYSMTKGALIAGSKSLACELAKRKIRVNTISPGVIVTPINENLPHIKDLDKRKALEDKHLLGLGDVEDVANACVFLLSDSSKWITGIDLIVDGGYTAR